MSAGMSSAMLIKVGLKEVDNMCLSVRSVAENELPLAGAREEKSAHVEAPVDCVRFVRHVFFVKDCLKGLLGLVGQSDRDPLCDLRLLRPNWLLGHAAGRRLRILFG
ncbi:hypothetical protein [Streptacidiphilus pinicola]|uniref:hypothetical protein n=1 Tax=Streptacidiphilus pinicola TaxID=2219663 RepID=UPI001057CC88|nr:hypothetical protein [Streptacidiphilus pinicola]